MFKVDTIHYRNKLRIPISRLSGDDWVVSGKALSNNAFVYVGEKCIYLFNPNNSKI
jgi:hypothetical protein